MGSDLVGILIRNEKKSIELPIKLIHPNINQPRKYFSEEELSGLAESIRENGLLQPIVVRKSDDGTYEIIAGERRYRACKFLGQDKISCIVMRCTDNESAVLALIENIQRANLSVFEEAQGIQTLINEFHITQCEAAKKLGISQSAIANKLRLLRLTEEEKAIIIKYGLTERHARALIRIDNRVQRLLILSKVIKDGLNVNKTEKLVDEILAKEQNTQKIKSEKHIVIKDVRIFINTINKAVNTMRMSGIDAETDKNEDENYIEYTVRIPKSTAIKYYGKAVHTAPDKT